MRNGRYLRSGQLLEQREYAKTLKRLAGAGAEDFYQGDVAQAFSEDFTTHGGLITLEDLRAYRPRISPPVKGTYRGHTVASAPPPSQGIQVIQILRALDDINLRALGWNSPRYIETVSRAMCEIFGETAEDARTAATESQSPGADATTGRDGLTEAKSDPLERRATTPDGQTTHVTVADGQGMVAACTHSIGSVAGAGLLTPGLGFLHNNLLGHFCPLPGRLDSIEAGKAMEGGAPTFVFLDDRSLLSVGSSGGSRLVSAIVQTIINLVDHGMSMQEAVTAPRFHSETFGVVYLEPETFAQSGADLWARGFQVPVTTYMGCNQAIHFTPGADGFFAGADPRGGQGLAVARTRG